MISKQFKSVKNIMESRDKIISSEQFKAVKDEIGNDFTKLATDLKPFYKYDANKFGYFDSVIEEMMGYVNRGRSYFAQSFPNVPDYMYTEIDEFMVKLRNMPTEYFEAKFNRAVSIGEFSAAVVPNDTDPRIINHFKDHGLKIVKYNGKPEARKAKIRALTNVLFQQNKGSITFMEDGRAMIDIFENGDVSTAIHELGHFIRRYALTPADLKIASKWAGESDINNWSVMGEEKFAEAFVDYMRSGNAPAPALKRIFEQMKKWLGEIYNKVMGSNVKVDKEIAALFDELLGGRTVETKKANAPKKAAQKPTGQITDAQEIQKVKNSISEGELILRSGKFNGKKKTTDELYSIAKSVDKERNSIGLPPYSGNNNVKELEKKLGLENKVGILKVEKPKGFTGGSTTMVDRKPSVKPNSFSTGRYVVSGKYVGTGYFAIERESLKESILKRISTDELFEPEEKKFNAVIERAKDAKNTANFVGYFGENVSYDADGVKTSSKVIAVLVGKSGRMYAIDADYYDYFGRSFTLKFNDDPTKEIGIYSGNKLIGALMGYKLEADEIEALNKQLDKQEVTEFSKEAKQLIDLLKKVKPTRSPIPILNHVAVRDGRMFTTDLTVFAYIDTDLDDGMYIVTQNGNLEYVADMDNDEYVLPLKIEDVDFEFSHDVSQHVDTFISHVSDDVLRSTLQGIYCEINGNVLNMTATDGYTLTTREFSLETKYKGTLSFILNPKAVNAAKQAQKITGAGATKFKVGSNGVSLNINGIEIADRTIEGQYPAYRRVIPDNSQYRMKIDVDHFKAAMKEITDFSKEKGLENTKLKFYQTYILEENGDVYLHFVDVDLKNEIKVKLKTKKEKIELYHDKKNIDILMPIRTNSGALAFDITKMQKVIKNFDGVIDFRFESENRAIIVTDQKPVKPPKAKKAEKESDVSGYPASLTEPVEGDISSLEDGKGETDAMVTIYDYHNDSTGVYGRKYMDETAGYLKDKKAVSARDVIDSLQKLLALIETPSNILHYGRVSLPKALGTHNRFTRNIEIKKWGDVPTALHEVAHSFQETIYPGNNFGNLGEILRLGSMLYPKKKNKATLKREGFAEFMAMYVGNRPLAMEMAPNTTGQFEKSLRELGLYDEVQKVSDLVITYTDQGSMRRVGSQIESRSKTPAYGRDATQKLAKALYESAQPLYKLQEKAMQQIGGKTPPVSGLDIFDKFSALRQTHSGIAESWIRRGMTKLNGRKVGMSLVDAVEGIERGEDATNFTIYLFARRALELLNRVDENGDAAPVDPGIRRADAMKVFRELDSPRYRNAAMNVYKWNDGVLQYMVEAGALTTDQYDQIVKRNKNYIPLQRIFDDMADRFKSGTGSDPIKRIKGSGRPIRNPFQTLQENAEKMALRSNEAIVIRMLVNIADSVTGMADFISRVPHKSVPISVPSDDTIRKILGDLHERFDEDIADSIFPDGFDDILGDFITFWKPADVGSKEIRDGVIAYRHPDDGVIRWYRVRPDVYETLTGGLNPYHLGKLADATLGKSARAFKLGTTGMRASFSLVTNPLRDLGTFIAQTHSNLPTYKLVPLWFKSMGESVQFLVSGKASPEFELFYNLGGNLANFLGTDTAFSRRASQEIFKTGGIFKVLKSPTELVKTPGYMIDILRDILQIPESASRVAEIKALAKEIGWDGSSDLTYDQSVRMLLAAKRVTTDFTASGDVIGALNKIWPFINPAVQGTRTFGRTLRGNPKRRAAAAVINFTMPSLFLWWLNKDKDWYRNMPFKERFLKWYIEVSPNHIIGLPRPFEWGTAFATVPETLIDAYYAAGMLHENVSGELKQLAEFVFDSFFNPGVNVINGVPVPGIPTLTLGMELASNKTAFFGTPIEPRYMQRLPQGERFSKYTTETAKFLGEMFNISPSKIDHVINGTFGRAAGDLVRTLEIPIVEKKDERDFEPADIPVVGTLFKRGGSVGTRSQAQYDLYDKLDYYRLRSASKNITEQERDKAKNIVALLQNAANAIAELKKVYYNIKELDKRQKIQIRIIKLAKSAIRDSEMQDILKQDINYYKRTAKELKRAKQ